MSLEPATPEEVAEVTGEADGVADGSAAGKVGRPKMHEEHGLLHAGLVNPGVGMRNLSEVVRSVMDISHGTVANMVKACVEMGWLR